MAQYHNMAEIEQNIREGAPDVILIAATLPESMKVEIRGKITTVLTITTQIPMAPADPQETAYERAVLGFEEAVFDALQRTIPAERPVYVSFATM